MAASVVVAGAAMGVAHAASFNCAKAKSPMERAICADKDLSEADTEMGRAYGKALRALPPEAVSKLRVDQVRWLAWLQTGCGIAGITSEETKEAARAKGKESEAAKAAQEENAAADLPKLAKCMIGEYRGRTEVLQHAFARVNGILFLTRSMYLLAPEENSTPEYSTFQGFGSLEASWPEAQTTDASWVAWNRAMLEAVQRSASVTPATEDSYCDHCRMPKWDDSMAESLDATVTAGTPAVDGNRVHNDVLWEGMGHGAAHPNEAYRKLTWLLKEQRALQPEDVFRRGSGWKKAMSEACWKDLKATEKSSGEEMLYDWIKGPESKEILRVVTNPANWTIAKDGLSVSWPNYSVMPRLFHPDDTVVPWTVLQAYLSSDFHP